jgi:hypothetical protein
MVTLSELGPVSQAILDYVNATLGYILFSKMILEVARMTETSHTDIWYFRRLLALALEGRIEGRVFRTSDDVAIKFRRLQETKSE